jgi:hypothetical protein
MPYLEAPFSGEMNRTVAHLLATKYLAETVTNLTNAEHPPGPDWVLRKLSFLPGAKYVQYSLNDSVGGKTVANETWFIPFMRKGSSKLAKNFKKFGKAYVTDGMAMLDTLFNPIPPGTFAPGADVSGEINGEMHRHAPDISKRLTGHGTGWTDLLILFFSQLDGETRAGGKIQSEELNKILESRKTFWLAVQQLTPVDRQGQIYKRAELRVGPSSNAAMFTYSPYEDSRSHGSSNSPFSTNPYGRGMATANKFRSKICQLDADKHWLSYKRPDTGGHTNFFPNKGFSLADYSIKAHHWKTPDPDWEEHWEASQVGI